MSDDAHRWPEPPDPELEALFAAARTPPAAPAGARSKVFERVALTVAAPLGGPGQPIGGAADTGTAHVGGATGASSAAGTSASAGTTASAGASVSVATGASAWSAAVIGVLALGLAGGVWLALSASDPAPAASPPVASPSPPAGPAAPDPGPTPGGSLTPAPRPPSGSNPVSVEPPPAASGAETAGERRPPAATPSVSPSRVISPSRVSHRAPAHARPRPNRTRIVPKVPAPTERASAPPPGPATPAAHGPADAPAAGAPAGPGDLALSAERRLLLTAMRGIEAGDLPAARVALDRHARRFPSGRLADERAVLHIRWLLAARRPEDARAAADAFRARAPGSLMGPAVDRLVPPDPAP